jgi:hypothetical protein
MFLSLSAMDWPIAVLPVPAEPKSRKMLVDVSPAIQRMIFSRTLTRVDAWHFG